MEVEQGCMDWYGNTCSQMYYYQQYRPRSPRQDIDMIPDTCMRRLFHSNDCAYRLRDTLTILACPFVCLVRPHLSMFKF
jgi:hypothetical protein